MTAEQYALRVIALKAGLTKHISDQFVVDDSPEIVDRFIFSGVSSEEDWLTTLKAGHDEIRLLAILMQNLNLAALGATNAGHQFNPFVSFGLELYATYKLGTSTVNTEVGFIKDAAKVLFGLGKNRKVMTDEEVPQCVGVITKASMQLGVRISKLTTLHYGKGTVTVDMRDLPYS